MIYKYPSHRAESNLSIILLGISRFEVIVINSWVDVALIAQEGYSIPAKQICMFSIIPPIQSFQAQILRTYMICFLVEPGNLLATSSTWTPCSIPLSYQNTFVCYYAARSIANLPTNIEYIHIAIENILTKEFYLTSYFLKSKNKLKIKN